jgi:hypothetical protein
MARRGTGVGVHARLSFSRLPFLPAMTTSPSLLRLISLCIAVACLPARVAADPAGAPRLLVRYAGPGAEAGRVEIVNARTGASAGALELHCDRVHANQQLVACLRTVAGQGVKLDLADRQGKVQATLNFPNVVLASRLRVSRDGALVGLTGFNGGHSYTGTDFSTRTYIVDAPGRRLLADVSTFRVIDSATLKLPARRFNVWGVSFHPQGGGRFVATVGAAGEVFLAAGDLKAKTLTLLRPEMECPSLSPDGTRVAFKRRDGAGGWRPAVYEFASGREWTMQEARSIDDQIEWLDNDTITYELAVSATSTDTDVVLRKADGSGASRVLRARAGSPAAFD